MFNCLQKINRILHTHKFKHEGNYLSCECGLMVYNCKRTPIDQFLKIYRGAFFTEYCCLLNDVDRLTIKFCIITKPHALLLNRNYDEDGAFLGSPSQNKLFYTSNSKNVYSVILVPNICFAAFRSQFLYPEITYGIVIKCLLKSLLKNTYGWLKQFPKKMMRVTQGRSAQ